MKMTKKSPYAAAVHTSADPECDTEMMDPRVDLSVDNLRDKIPAPAHKGGVLATVGEMRGGK